MPTVLLGVTGCIAAYKSCEILRELQRRNGSSVRVIMTRHATEFVSPLTFEALSGHAVHLDAFGSGAGSAMPHVRWPMEADLLLVAPATANMIGKMAHGIADDALSTLYLATRAPVVVAPAMNVEMWRHPAVAANVAALGARGVTVVEPATGQLACGTVGEGRLADVGRVVDVALARLAGRRDLQGLKVLVTAGPTREALDPVRYLSNRSSGRMGFRVAEAARDRGADVILVSGPVALEPPWGVACHRVVSADEMAAAAEEHAARVDVAILAAAVADHRPAVAAKQKLKKDEAPLHLDLVPTPDIASKLGHSLSGRVFLVGFAAETQDLLASARRKLGAKGLDLIVANDVGAPGTGFESEDNAATLIGRDGDVVELGTMTKRALAERILDRVVLMRSPGGVRPE